MNSQFKIKEISSYCVNKKDEKMIQIKKLKKILEKNVLDEYNKDRKTKLNNIKEELTMLHAIINNTTGMKIGRFNEYDEIASKLVHGTEEEIKKLALELKQTRIHFFESFQDDYDVTWYKYITTIGV